MFKQNWSSKVLEMCSVSSNEFKSLITTKFSKICFYFVVMYFWMILLHRIITLQRYSWHIDEKLIHLNRNWSEATVLSLAEQNEVKWRIVSWFLYSEHSVRRVEWWELIFFLRINGIHTEVLPTIFIPFVYANVNGIV